MKKISVLFSVIAFTFAVAGAFASSMVSRTQDPTFINLNANPSICEDAVGVVCEGGTTDCVKYVEAAGGEVDIWNHGETGCLFRLTME